MKKRYWAVIVVLFPVGLDCFTRTPDSRSRQLTGIIATQGSAKLKSYPYQFRVLQVRGETAFISTPRNFQVPAFKALAVLYPEIDTLNANDPAFIAAQTMLGEVQSEARAIVLAQPGIEAANWQLDREWLAAHHIEVPEK